MTLFIIQLTHHSVPAHEATDCTEKRCPTPFSIFSTIAITPFDIDWLPPYPSISYINLNLHPCQPLYLIRSHSLPLPLCFFYPNPSEGKEWHRARRTIGRKIMPPREVAKFTGVINEIVTDMVERLRFVRDTKGEGDGVVPELQNEMYKWSMECEYIPDAAWCCPGNKNKKSFYQQQ